MASASLRKRSLAWVAKSVTLIPSGGSGSASSAVVVPAHTDSRPARYAAAVGAGAGSDEQAASATTNPSTIDRGTIPEYDAMEQP